MYISLYWRICLKARKGARFSTDLDPGKGVFHSLTALTMNCASALFGRSEDQSWLCSAALFTNIAATARGSGRLSVTFEAKRFLFAPAPWAWLTKR